MIDPPCGVWDFIWFATADGRSEPSAFGAVTDTPSPTLGHEEGPVQVHRSRALPGTVWHGQEFCEGAYPDIANEYIYR